MMFLLCLALALASCAIQPGPTPPAPEPPLAVTLPAELSDSRPVRKLKSAIEDVVTEVDAQEQREEAAAARERFDALVREHDLNDEQVAALRRWIAWTAYTRYMYGDPSFLRGYIVSGKAEAFRKRYPRVLNDVGLTTTQAWVDAVLLPTDPHYKANNRVDEIMRIVDGLRVQPDSKGFVHVDLEKLPIERLLREGDTYDDVIVMLYNADAVVATRALMRLTQADEEERAESVAVVARADPLFADIIVAKSKADIRRGKPPGDGGDATVETLKTQAEALLLDLADDPHWPVHLYVLDRLLTYHLWFGRADTSRVRAKLEAHDNPITSRWIKDHAETYR